MSPPKTATALAERGCRVAVNYFRSGDEAEVTTAALCGFGVDAFAVRADVSNEVQVRAIIGQIVARFGRIDLVVNDAGYTRSTPVEYLDTVTAED